MRFKKFTIFLLCLIFILPSISPAQNISSRAPLEASSQADKTSAVVGDIITYTLNLNYSPEASIQFPDFGSNFGGLNVIETGGVGPQDEEGRIILQKWAKLKADKAGSFTLPALKITYKQKTNPNPGEISTSEIFINIKGNNDAKEQQDIIDIKGLESLGINYKFWAIIGGIILLAALILGGIFYYRYKRKPKAEEAIVIKRPAHEIALEGFYKLRAAKYYGPDEIKKIYFELSEIFRVYLEDRFNFPASDWTTEEIIYHLNKNEELNFELKSWSKLFLTNTDMVKFAEYVPDKLKINEEIERAIEIVKNTMIENKETNNEIRQ